MPKRYAPALFSLFMSLLVSGTISLVMTLLDLGLGPGFLQAWLSSLGLGVAIAFPVSLIADRPLRSAVARLTVDESQA